MSTALRPRRSALFVPGANRRALEKARSLPCDVLILDLEDAVTPSEKVAAREQVCGAAASDQYQHCEVVIRINGLDTSWHLDDIRATVTAKPSAIVIPKVSSAADILAVGQKLDAAGVSSQIQLWAVLETAQGILNAAQIAASSSRLSVLLMGTNDLVNELHAEHVPDRRPLLYSLSHCLLAARAVGKVILDGVYNDLTNAQGFETQCMQSRSLGFDGKTLIHPSQIEICNRVFTPSLAEVEQAQKIIAQFEKVKSEGKGVATVDGRLIENVHAESARRTLALAEMFLPSGRGKDPLIC